MPFQIYTGGNVPTGVILGGISSSLGGIPANVTIDGGAQIATIDGFDGAGNGVPLYAYVANALPRVTISFNNGFDGINNSDANSLSAEFAQVGGGSVNINVSDLIPDPSGSRSTGGQGGQVTFLKQYSDGGNPFA